MNLSANGARLSELTKELMAKWEATQNCWRDAKCLEFEKKYIDPLLIKVDHTIKVTQQLDQLSSKIKKDCE